jgi:VWFA-related protein
MRYHNPILKIRRLKSFRSLPVLIAFLLAVHAQEQKQTKSDDQDIVKVTSNLVSLDVIVKDKKGRLITDLKAEDFTVIENGVPQKIEFFDSTLTTATEVTQSTNTAGSTETKPPKTPSGFPRNIVALVLDGQSTELANLKHVREGILKYVRERVSENDSVALFAISGGLQLLQPFTHNKGDLIAAVEKAYDSSIVSKTSEARGISENISALRDKVASGPPGDSVASSPSAGSAGSAMAEKMLAQRMLEEYVQLRSVLSAQQTRPVLAALAAIAEGLRSVPGKKTVVMFSQGFVAPESLDWQIQSTVDIANRANVAIYIIDSTGLTGGTPTSGALVPSSPLAGISGAVPRNSGSGPRRVKACLISAARKVLTGNKISCIESRKILADIF